jgi:hypothetical protein
MTKLTIKEGGQKLPVVNIGFHQRKMHSPHNNARWANVG